MNDLQPIRQSLLWTPRVKARPRTMFIQGGYRTYTPHETRAAERALRQQWVGKPTEGPVMVGLTMFDDHIEVTVIPSLDCTSRKLKRGDIDNYSKLIMDALNGRAWTDDRQIVALSVRKM